MGRRSASDADVPDAPGAPNAPGATVRQSPPVRQSSSAVAVPDPVPNSQSSIAVYSTCLFCHADLGRNEAVTSFPVGRRLAFDSANGRFWVICESCKRWNLSPLEERWEAMDECERLYEGTRLRMSTDNVGLARIGEGTELVRVGAALRPEMAAWRFGAQLAARRRKYRWVVAGGVVGAAVMAVGVKTAGTGFIGGNWGWQLLQAAYERATRIVLPTPPERLVDPVGVLNRPLPELLGRERPPITAPVVETKHARKGLIERADGDSGFLLTVPVVGRDTVRYDAALSPRVLAKMLTKVNRSGGRKEDERLAVGMLESVAAHGAHDLPLGVLEQYARKRLFGDKAPAERTLGKIGATTTLALEMALNEQREREVLAGELLDLEFAWKEAEELARIADTLESSSIDRALAALKARMER